MAPKGNVFTVATFNLLDELARIEVAAAASSILFRQNEARHQQLLIKLNEESEDADRQANDSPHVRFRTVLPVVDVFVKAGFNKLSHRATSIADEKYFHLIREIYCRSNAQSICMVYEVFERFIKSFAALLFFQERKTVELARKKWFHRNHPELVKAKGKNTAEYFQAYVDLVSNRNCDDLLDELADLLPDFKKTCAPGNFPDLFAIYRAVSKIRHLTVHCNGRFTEKDFKKLGEWDLGFLKSITTANVLDGKGTLLPFYESTLPPFEGIGGMAWCMYRLASEKYGMVIQYPRA